MKIYLAGKIGKTCWRHAVVKGLRHAPICEDFGWPVMPKAIFGHDYVGPYFLSDDHGGAHNPSEHAMMRVNGETLPCDGIPKHGGDLEWVGDNARARVFRTCMDSLWIADHVFVWLTDRTAFGTLVEIGFAHAMGKPITIAYPHDDDSLRSDLWFAFECASTVIASHIGPYKPLRHLCREHLPGRPTPIELAFYRSWFALTRTGPQFEIEFQHPVKQYFLDFAHLPTKTAIELDGMKGHSTPADIEKDRRRQREIEAEGWRFIRFRWARGSP